MKFKNNIGMAKKKIDLSKIIVYIAIVVAFAIFFYYSRRFRFPDCKKSN